MPLSQIFALQFLYMVGYEPHSAVKIPFRKNRGLFFQALADGICDLNICKGRKQRQLA